MKCDREGCTMPVGAYGASIKLDGKEYNFCCSSCLGVFLRWRDYHKQKERVS
jgi:YHS domain-containing protein